MKSDQEALIEKMLIEQYPKYYRIAWGYVRQEEAALDVVQEGAYKAIRHAAQLKQPEYADTWICRIMMHEAAAYFRKNGRERAALDREEQGREDDYEDMDLRKAMDALSPNERAVIQLRFFEDMSLQQVAQVMDDNLSTVKSRLYRALSKLRISLETP